MPKTLKDLELPKHLGDKLKFVPKATAKEMHEKLLKFRELIGEKGVGTSAISKEDLDKRMVAIRTNPAALPEVLRDNMKLSDIDGRPLVRKDFMEAYRNMNEKFKEAGLA